MQTGKAKKTAPLSPWAASVLKAVDNESYKPLYKKKDRQYQFEIVCTVDSVLILSGNSSDNQIIFRPVYSPDGLLQCDDLKDQGDTLYINLSSTIGKFELTISWPEQDFTVLRYTTSLKPDRDLFIPFWPRDIIVPEINGALPEGSVQVQQVLTRSGLLYVTMQKPAEGSLLYLQNLTAINDYCQETETSLSDAVGGPYPEIGLSLPAAKEKPLKAGSNYIISDAIVVLDPQLPKDEPTTTTQFLNLLATAYLVMPRPETEFHNWPNILDKGLKDLETNSGCWSQVKGKEYVNAYVCDYQTPPEVMVQLAVLLPLRDYADWSGQKIECIDTLKDTLVEFYDDKLKTIMRWLPAAEGKLTGDEEQKKPKVMDSWYLHHPLLNLSRLALKGDDQAKELFLNSIDYAIKVAHHFKYDWPVFYNMDTLEVLKAETAEGKGGEKDVPGAYAHVMLQAYDLTEDRKYLAEAEKAVKKLKGLGFELFYQANNVSFAAGALLRLYKLTKKQTYLDLSYLCMANILRNCRLWDCNYGYGRHFPSFFTLFPLNDAPYTAAYEEQEVFCAIHDYLGLAEDVDILPSLRLLACEYIRYVVARAAYYYPPMLPQEALEEKPKTGEVDHNLWIAVEDLHDGWEKNGAVGQEVYGAGNAFGILPRHYHRIKDQDFMIRCDYPITNYSVGKGKASFNLLGDPRMSCRLAIVPGESKLPNIKLTIAGKAAEFANHKFNDGRLECTIPGDADVQMTW